MTRLQNSWHDRWLAKLATRSADDGTFLPEVSVENYPADDCQLIRFFAEDSKDGLGLRFDRSAEFGESQKTILPRVLSKMFRKLDRER